jgi:pimeloyl-ACP methyl ester carboxylesterase
LPLNNGAAGGMGLNRLSGTRRTLQTSIRQPASHPMELIDFDSHGTRLRAAWYRPATAALRNARGAPCVVMAHGLGGTRAAGLAAFAERFAAAGLHVLCFDYRGFGDSGGEPRQVVSVKKQLEDWAAAIAQARTLDGVDSRRVATWGSSFSGAHAVAAAVEDGRIAAVSSQGAMMDGLASLVNLIRQAGIGHALRLSAYGLRDAIAALLKQPRITVPVVGPPGSHAALTTPDSEPGYKRIAPPDWTNEISASWALTLGLYRPNTMTPRLPCPALFCIATADVVVPPSAMEDGARRGGDKVEVRRYPVGHFDIYVPPAFDDVIADQVEFFTRVLKPA